MEEYDDLKKTGQVVCSTIKEEKRDEEVIMIGNSSGSNDRDCKEGLNLLKDGRKLEMARAQMGEVREENQRLRLYLDQVMKEYQILQKKFQEIMKTRSAAAASTKQQCSEMEDSDQLVSLSLGRTFSGEFKKDNSNTERSKTTPSEKEGVNGKEGLALGLEYSKFEVSSTTQAESSIHLSPESSTEEAKTWQVQKNLKMKRSVEDDHSSEATPQNPPKKTRVSVRVRCDTPTMNDGCQWRKYGQKIAKGNPCPRAYYRCTVSPSCPVRKQVQRCAQDMSILITTYEGTHNHPLPMSATAMASTTSAAASMLTSGSMTSSMSNPNSSIGTTDLRGMSLYLTDNSKLRPFYAPHASSTTPSCPTITLDLTSNTVSSSASPYNRSPMPAHLYPSSRFSTTNLNFNPLESSALPISWSNGVLGYNNTYNGAQAQVPYDHKNQIGFGSRQPQENIYQSYMQKSSNMPMINSITPPIPQAIQPETIEAATKAITSDPNFQSALQVALTSIIARGGHGAGGGGGDKFGPSLRLPFSNSNGKSSSPETSQDRHVLR